MFGRLVAGGVGATGLACGFSATGGVTLFFVVTPPAFFVPVLPGFAFDATSGGLRGERQRPSTGVQRILAVRCRYPLSSWPGPFRSLTAFCHVCRLANGLFTAGLLPLVLWRLLRLLGWIVGHDQYQ